MHEAESLTHPLAYVRAQHDWSQADLALLIRRAALRIGQRSGVDRNRVWRWETGREKPGPQAQRLLAMVLEVPSGQVEHLGWPWWVPAYAEIHSLTHEGRRAALREVRGARMDRRAFLITGSSALAGLAGQWATAEPAQLAAAMDGSRVDTQLVVWLEERCVELRRLANGSATTIRELLDAHLNTTIQLIEQGSYIEEIARRLHAVVAGLAQTRGFLAFDQGLHGQAQRYWQAALHASHAADDRDLGAGILSDLAYQCTWLHRPAEAADILTHALTDVRAPVARSLLQVRKARALAVTGDGQACRDALTHAEAELGRAWPDTAPTWCEWMSPADLAADAGRCWLDLGEHAEASRSIAEGLRHLEPTRQRTRAIFLVYQAETALHTGDIPTAATLTRAAWDVAEKRHAARCISLTRSVTERLRPYRDVAEVTELLAVTNTI